MKFLKSLFTLCLVFTALSGRAQQQARFVDIHNHVTLKNYLRAVEHADSLLRNPEHYAYENWYTLTNAHDVEEKSNSSNFFQGDFMNLAGGGFKIVCNSVTPIEYKSFFTRLDRLANGEMETKIAPERLINLNKSTSFKEFQADHLFLATQKNLTVDKLNPVNFKLVKNKAELLECMKTNTVAIINTIEGGHALYGERNKEEGYFLNPYCDDACKKEILYNTVAIKEMDYRIFFMGICHLFSNKLAGNAKALDIGANTRFNRLVMRRVLTVLSRIPYAKLLLDAKHFEGIAAGEKKLVNPNNFKPKGEMYSTIGKDVINVLLDTQIGPHKKPIYIDVKHMDVQSRIDYYNMLDSNAAWKNSIPIICSHAAASGKNQRLASITGNFPYFDNFEENRNPGRFYKRRWKKWEREFGISKNDTPSQIGWLNPFSINLYDEEIKKIYDSDGLIGVILEQRSLGGYMRGYSEERQDSMQTYLQVHHQLSKDDAKLYLETEPFLRNLFYFVEKSGRSDTTAWKTVCLGTDFDGFIDPINSCPTAAFVPQFEKLLVRFIPIYLSIVYKDNRLLYGLSPQQAVNKVMYENAEGFIMKYF